MEEERKINWLGLFIKIIIIFIFVLIIIWLISKITTKTRLSSTFKSNINNMETVATNYFKEVDLPLEKDKSLKITLEEMIEKGLIVSLDNKDKDSCDTKKSFSKITRKKSNYELTTTLKCGNESSTITKKVSLKDCRNCNANKKEDKAKNNDNTDNKEVKNNSSTNEEKTNESSQTTTNNSNSGVTYYEYVKETVTYTKWMKGNTTGDNIENRYEYYGIANDTYYSLGVINESNFKVGNTINYTLKVNKVPNSKYYFSKIENTEYYKDESNSNYINEKDISLNNKKYSTPNNISKYSLTSNNFVYTLSPYYRKGIFYVDVEITITNTEGVSSYKDGNNKIYYVPLMLDIKFASDEITETVPSGEYETITYYRYVLKNKDILWSSENLVEGYTKTGNSEIR